MDEEREEGELTDEELEDVSDSSISLGSLTTLIYREPFKELSLTSVSDESSDLSIIEISPPKSIPVPSKLPNRHNRKYCKRKKLTRDYSPVKKIKRTKKHSKPKYEKQYSSLSSSSSESEQYIPDKKVLRQLRDAVRINSTKKNPNCSLRTRIKRMIDPGSHSSKHTNSEDDQELENLRDQALKSKQTNVNLATEVETSNITDEDLINLRLIALQSAVLKKHENRRKRKQQQKVEKNECEESVNNNEQDILLKTEINDIPLIENDIEHISPLKIKNEDISTITNNVQNLENENTEGIKIEMFQKDQNNEENGNKEKKEENHIADKDNENHIEDKENNKYAENKNHIGDLAENVNHLEDKEKIANHIENQVENENHIQDEENKEKISSKVHVQKTTPDEDEDILRAMLLTSISKKIANKINVKTNTAVKKMPEASKTSKTASNVKIKIHPVKPLVINVNSDSESDSNTKIIKSPKCFEQDLSKFLKEARIKSEIQQQSDISRHLPRSQQIEYRHLKRKLQQLSKKSYTKTKRFDGDENKRIRLNSATKKNVSRTKILNPLSNQATSPSKKQNKVDRLNIKGKYEELAPLMVKITHAKGQRDKAQNEVKRLINELRNARIRLTTTHQTYTVLVQQLLQTKAELDERPNVLTCSANQEKIKLNPAPIICTSTPYKENIKENVCEISNILKQSNTAPQQTIVQEEDLFVDKLNDTKDLSVNLNDMEIDEGDKVNSVIEENVKMIVDINKVQEEKKLDEGLAKYSSPLEHIKDNSEQCIGNPLLVLCPYDLMGMCRDPDCTYRH